MNLILEQLLDNILFIVVPLFFYQMYWVDRGYIQHKGSRFLITSMSAISIFLCMSFPVHITQDHLISMNFVPLISSILYGGLYAGLPLGILIIILSIFHNTQCMITSIFTTLFILFITPMTITKFHRFSLQRKMISAMLLSLFFSSFHLFVVYLNYNFTLQNIINSILFLLLQAFTMWLMTYLYEKIGQYVVMSNHLKATENLKVISELASSTSHDIRNPLTVTKGLLQLMAQTDFSTEKKEEFIQLAIDELTQAETIINDYLSLAKPDSGSEFITINISEYIHKAINVIKPYANFHSIEIMSHIETNIHINGNGSQLYRCLINLMKNCIEAMPNGGLLEIVVSSHQQDVIIKIKDTGVGMSSEEIRRLGTPFYTTKETGTGLGMIVVFSFIKSMLGRIDIHSEKEKGTEFTITFPLVNPL